MELDGVDLKTAIKHAAEFYSIPMRRLTVQELQRYALVKEAVEPLAVRLVDFHRGLQLVADRHLVPLLSLAAEAELLGDFVDNLTDQATALRNAKPKDIAAAWQGLRERDSERVRNLERIGKADRTEAEAFTWVMVDMLARSQEALAA
jgi:hypothetical protein